MAAQSLFDDCQTLIEKGHENWKSYFSKWESFAKYEEDLPESELFTTPKKKSKSSQKKKVKQQSVLIKSKALPSVKCKKNKSNRKKVLKRKRNQNNGRKVQILEKYNDRNNENVVEDMDNARLESILKSVFTEILKANKNDFQIFTILSQTISGRVTNSSQIYHHRLACSISNPLQSIPECGADVSSVCQHRSSYIGGLSRRWSLFETQMKPDTGIRKVTEYLSLSDTIPKFNIHQNNLNRLQFELPLIGSPTLRQTTQLNLPVENCSPAFSCSLRRPRLKSLEWDSSPKSPNSVCRKINNEYFIKRSLLKMNITQDGKRFRNLCLRKRTNSVTLSMENSNFITPERKPPERKCFSENVLRRKRTCPSKLFFGNEEEDSESDDETGKQTPIIHCRKKLKTQAISDSVNSDSEDCESIFDRVNVL